MSCRYAVGNDRCQYQSYTQCNSYVIASADRPTCGRSLWCASCPATCGRELHFFGSGPRTESNKSSWASTRKRQTHELVPTFPRARRTSQQRDLRRSRHRRGSVRGRIPAVGSGYTVRCSRLDVARFELLTSLRPVLPHSVRQHYLFLGGLPVSGDGRRPSLRRRLLAAPALAKRAALVDLVPISWKS